MEHRTEEYQVNIGKFQRVPVIHDGDFKLCESVAIFRYMTKKHPIDDCWYPKDLKERARVDEYLSWTHNNLRYKMSVAFYTKVWNPIVTGKRANPEVSEKYDSQLQRCLNEFEELWTDHKFIAGDHLTFADVVACCDLEQSSEFGF